MQSVRICGRTAAVLAALALGGPATAQEAGTLTAGQSDPETMGWMRGFPPPDDKVVRFTDPDYFAFPKLRWTVCHFRELMPTAGVRRGPGAARPFERAIDGEIGGVTFTPLKGGAPMTWDAAFDANYTDGVIVLHQGRIVYERYAGCLDETALHGAMSVTKSLTGLLAETLVAEGTLDATARVGALVPELDDSAFGDATVRQVMDMTTGLDYSEDYADPDADVWAYGEAASPLPKPEGYDGRGAISSFWKPCSQRAGTARRSATRRSTPTRSAGSSRGRRTDRWRTSSAVGSGPGSGRSARPTTRSTRSAPPLPAAASTRACATRPGSGR